MSKIILFNMISLDGFFAGLNGDINWHRVDEEFNEYAIEQLHTADGLIFGRMTYQLMASYWPTPAGLQDDPIIAEMMNTLPKIVASRTLEAAEWSNTRLIKANVVEEFRRLKQQPGRDLFVFGSANLSTTLIQHDLIDEYRLIVNPVVLGSGEALFQDIHQPLHLKLLKTKSFRNGNVLLLYQPETKAS
jgi:dihydrofolate reductase